MIKTREIFSFLPLINNSVTIELRLLLLSIQGHSQNFKKVPQNFIKALNVDSVTPTTQPMASYRKINIESEKIINYRVISPSIDCCQISFIVRERPGISVIIDFFLFLR